MDNTIQKQVTKKDLVNSISDLNNITKATAENIVDNLFCFISTSLLDGQIVVLPGIGQLKPATTAARSGVNPQTGQPIQIPEKNTVKFSVSAPLKRQLNL